MEWQCKHCKGVFNFSKPRSKGAHLTNCKDNPKRNAILRKISIANKKENITLTCKRCDKQFDVMPKYKGRKYCSRACANQRQLSDETIQKLKARQNYKKAARANKKDRGRESKFHQYIGPNNLTRHQKAKLAEAAVLFRLILHDFIVFGSLFDGDKADWVIEDKSGNHHKIQVKWTKKATNGLPTISLRCTEGKELVRYKDGDFDFIVGYNYYNDTAYVFDKNEVGHLKTSVTINKDAAEAWHKIQT